MESDFATGNQRDRVFMVLYHLPLHNKKSYVSHFMMITD